MILWVIDGQPFGGGGVVEGLVGGDQRHRGKPESSCSWRSLEGGGELHGVVGAQAMGVGQPHSVVEQGGRDVDEGIAPGKMLAEAVEDRRCLGGGERPAFAAAGDGGGDFDGGDAGDVDDGGRRCAASGGAPRLSRPPGRSA